MNSGSFLRLAVVMGPIAGIIILASCDKSSEPQEPANRRPTAPMIDTLSSTPPDGSTGRSITPTLQWTCSDPDDDSLFYDVYLGTDTIPPIVADSLTAMSYTTDTLEYVTLYYWKVVATDQHGTFTSSALWSFTTRAYADDQPPTISITSPLNGDSIVGTATITADAADNEAVTKVEFYIDDSLYAEDFAGPFSCDWNSADHPDSSLHVIVGMAYDDAGNCGTSDAVSFFSFRDLTPPTVTLLFPPPDTILSGTITISVDASDDIGVACVQFFIDSHPLHTDSLQPWTYNWLTSVYPDNTQHSIFCKAFDKAGNSGSTDVIVVSVDNNNHPPQTYIMADWLYANAAGPDSPCPGIAFSWYATDYYSPVNDFEYEWRLYGPFLDTATIPTTDIAENCYYDPWGDSFVCDSVTILDLDAIPPTLMGIPQPVVRSQGPSFPGDPTDVWTTDTTTTIYDVLNGLPSDTSRQYQYVIWVRARDDLDLPDSSAAFHPIFVIDPKFEKDIAVFDETYYTVQTGRWAPRNRDTVKAYFFDLFRDQGYLTFDTAQGGDYFYRNDVHPYEPRLLDYVSYRTIVYYHDDVVAGPDITSFGVMPGIFLAIDAGASCWAMVRGLGGATQNTLPNTVVNLSDDFARHFGVRNAALEGWFGQIWAAFPESHYNEQFIGAHPVDGALPQIDVDFALVDSRYPRFVLDTSHVMVGQPEIGCCTRTADAVPIYVYESRLPADSSPYFGKVCAVYCETDGMRTSLWQFTPLAMDQQAISEAAAMMFNFLDPGSQPGGALSRTAIRNRRERIQRFMHHLSQYAPLGVLEKYGIPANTRQQGMP